VSPRARSEGGLRRGAWCFVPQATRNPSRLASRKPQTTDTAQERIHVTHALIHLMLLSITVFDGVVPFIF